MLGFLQKNASFHSQSRQLLTSCRAALRLSRPVVSQLQLRWYSEETAAPAETSEQAYPAHPISTLNPAQLTADDYLDLSSQSIKRIIPKVADGTIKVGGKPRPWNIYYGARTPWPENAGGFMYLRKPPPGGPLGAASVRIRITNNPDPASFAQGTDLEYKGLPWNVLLARMHTDSAGILLRQSGEEIYYTAVSKFSIHMRAHRSKSPIKSSPWMYIHTPLLYRLNQPFRFDFTQPRTRLWLLSGSKDVSMPPLRQMMHSAPSLMPGESPSTENPEGESRPRRFVPLYSGQAVVRLEAKKGDEDTLQLGLRIIKVVEPIVPNPAVEVTCPELKEGSLVPYMQPESGLLYDYVRRSSPSNPAYYYASFPEIPEDD